MSSTTCNKCWKRFPEGQHDEYEAHREANCDDSPRSRLLAHTANLELAARRAAGIAAGLDGSANVRANLEARIGILERELERQRAATRVNGADYEKLKEELRGARAAAEAAHATTKAACADWSALSRELLELRGQRADARQRAKVRRERDAEELVALRRYREETANLESKLAEEYGAELRSLQAALDGKTGRPGDLAEFEGYLSNLLRRRGQS